MSERGRKDRGTLKIGDVARAAGVSAMTVSRVINGEPRVREATREKVRDAIERLKFAPNPAAQSLATGQPFIRIGLLYENPSSAYLSQFLIGALKQARLERCQVLLENCGGESVEAMCAAARKLLLSGVEGVVLPPPLSESQPVLFTLAARDMPVAAVETLAFPQVPLVVRIDDYQAAREVARHLLSLGHRRIGFIRGNPAQSASHRREAGFRDTLAAAGIVLTDDLVQPGCFTFRTGLAAAERLLDLAEPPTAIFASNDDMAAAVVGVAARRGIKVPQQLSVVGYDDVEAALAVWPPLSTVRQPIAEMGAAAIRIVAAAIRARRLGRTAEPTEVVMGHDFIRRDSTAPPAIAPEARRPVFRQKEPDPQCPPQERRELVGSASVGRRR